MAMKKLLTGIFILLFVMPADAAMIKRENPVSDAAYDESWNGETKKAPSKNSVYDKIENIELTPGPQGPAGPAGADGAAGPNLVGSTTATDLTGILKGNGSTVTPASAGTDYVATEVDPKVGTLTNTKWCSSNGSVVSCTEDEPTGVTDHSALSNLAYGTSGHTGFMPALANSETITSPADGTIRMQGVGGSENYTFDVKLQNDATSTLQLDSNANTMEFLKNVQIGDGKVLAFGDTGNDRYGQFQMLNDGNLKISTTAGGIELAPLTSNGLVTTSGGNGALGITDPATFQAALVSGTNIKTINSTSLLGSGDIAIAASPVGATGQIQYNNAGAFAADASLSWDNTAKSLDVYGSLAAEKVTNGAFDSASGWTTTTGWAIGSGKANHSSNGTGTLSQNVSAVIGDIYQVSFDISGWSVGSVTVVVGGTTVASALAANGTYNYKVAATTTGNLIFTPTNTARFSIDNVSIKKLQGGVLRSSGTRYLSGQDTISAVNSTYTPGTLDHLTLLNPTGTYSHIAFKHGTFIPAAITANHSGTTGYLKLQAYGGGAIYARVNETDILSIGSSGMYVNQPIVLNNKLSAGIGSINPANRVSLAHSQGRSGTMVTANSYTTTDYDYALYCDSTFAQACTGTPSGSCASRSSEGTCTPVGCTWTPGTSCAVYNNEYGMGSCSGQSGCSADQSACSGGDQWTCEAADDSYGGNCTWTAGGTYNGCSGDYSSWCGNWTGYTQSDCSTNSGGYCEMPGGDYTTCQMVSTGCAGLPDEYTCNGSNSPYISGCTPSYTSDTCSGNYYTGNCSGEYGAACSGTPLCGLLTETPCGSESGCTWSSAQSINLQPGSAVTDSSTVGRVLYIKKVRGSGTVTIYPYSGDDIDGSSSYALSTVKDAVQLHYFPLGVACNYISTSAACADQSGCSWVTCSGYGDQESCQSAGCTWGESCTGDYCSGTAVYTKRWHVLSQKD